VRGKVAYASKAEHDFQRPEGFDPREYANRIPWQLGDERATAEIWVSDRIAWHVERNFGRYGELSPADDGGRIFRTSYAIPRLVLAWVIGYEQHAHVQGPPELVDELHNRLDRVAELHRGEPFTSVAAGRAPEAAPADRAVENGGGRQRDSAGIRPERFARLVTLASVLIQAGRKGEKLRVAEVCERLQMSPQELREDVAVLNVVNFGGGAYVLYAEVLPTGEIEVDPEPYSDTFDRPARLLPIEARALLAAIELLGVHLSEDLVTARRKLERALGDIAKEGLLVSNARTDDTIAARVGEAIEARRLIELEYYNEHEDRFSTRVVEPYALINGREGWYVATYDPSKDDMRHFRLDRVKRADLLEETYEPRADLDPVADVEGWPRTGQVGGSRRAHVWISPGQARWAREQHTVLAELDDGAVIVEWAFKGERYLVKEILKEAGDAAVLEPPDVRDQVLVAVERLLAPSSR
jgi:proteasome accessory factor C